MKVILCLDQNNGMLFNRRRQSKDALVRSRILQHCKNGRLLMNAYSKNQFTQEHSIVVDEDFLKNASDTDYCFVENVDITPVIDKIDTLIVYRWNRTYPGDVKAPGALFQIDWKKISSVEFTGKSHPCITEEIYER